MAIVSCPTSGRFGWWWFKRTALPEAGAGAAQFLVAASGTIQFNGEICQWRGGNYRTMDMDRPVEVPEAEERLDSLPPELWRSGTSRLGWNS